MVILLKRFLRVVTDNQGCFKRSVTGTEDYAGTLFWLKSGFSSAMLNEFCGDLTMIWYVLDVPGLLPLCYGGNLLSGSTEVRAEDIIRGRDIQSPSRQGH